MDKHSSWLSSRIHFRNCGKPKLRTDPRGNVEAILDHCQGTVCCACDRAIATLFFLFFSDRHLTLTGHVQMRTGTTIKGKSGAHYTTGRAGEHAGHVWANLAFAAQSLHLSRTGNATIFLYFIENRKWWDFEVVTCWVNRNQWRQSFWWKSLETAHMYTLHSYRYVQSSIGHSAAYFRIPCYDQTRHSVDSWYIYIVHERVHSYLAVWVHGSSTWTVYSAVFFLFFPFVGETLVQCLPNLPDLLLCPWISLHAAIVLQFGHYPVSRVAPSVSPPQLPRTNWNCVCPGIK